VHRVSDTKTRLSTVGRNRRVSYSFMLTFYSLLYRLLSSTEMIGVILFERSFYVPIRPSCDSAS